MTNPHGSFIWYELLTTDPAAAARFYGSLLGWTEAPHGGPDGGPVPGYSILSHGGQAIGGLMQAPEGVPPVWLGYVAVEDVDAAVADIQAAGGAVQMPARDIGGVGRIAMVADPRGAPFYVMRGSSDRASVSFDAEAIGHCAWQQLSTSDAEAAIDFYAGRFGWKRGEALPMGPSGAYQLMELQGRPFGAIMPRQDAAPPHWAFVFRVARIGEAAQLVPEGGGTIVYGPAEVPGGDHVIFGLDPQGALFAVIGKPG
ncbi:VOC family protein [Falsiroseomonas tokyonensis]|uniref:VOC family protein n=1 Tax=Falsiroseomonas tokyonensis TaxID=430521 RepID=A0ABV7C208_9PROT|nr:VOC family protein [Falsiroseomonas tokyonensis]MBU8540677.1 VOC family protein [Falsiroseomonas tokyonensis]